MDKFTTYVNILADGLTKKIAVLEKITAISEKQYAMVNSKQVDEDEFEKLTGEKGNLISELERLDDGFATVYDRVKGEFEDKKYLVADQITKMKENISTITELSVKLQACEQRTKSAVENYFTSVKTDIKSVKTSSGVAANYYKTMNTGNRTSVYMDEKK